MNTNPATQARRKNTFGLFLGLALLSVAAATTGAMAVHTETDPGAAAGIAELQQTGKAFSLVTKEVAPAVVFIKAEKDVTVGGQAMYGSGQLPLDEETLKKFFGDQFGDSRGFKFQTPQPHQEHSVAQGSGFVITPDGYILTNNHVVEDASKLGVTLADGRKFAAKVIGVDSESDVAVIKIDGKNLPVLKMGDSDAMEVGEWVLAVGSPFGLAGTVTSGIISATGRSSVGIANYENFIQTDAAINPGNSGGPLVNLHGEAIGINTAIASRTGVYNGIGFAIPINMARTISNQLIENGSVTRGFLGISIQQLTPELAKSFGLADEHGVLIGGVSKGSPAAKAGLKAGDVVVEFAGKPVTEIGRFRNMVATTPPKTSVKFGVIRDGKHVNFNVTIGRLPSSNAVARVDGKSAHEEVHSLGLSVTPLTDEIRQQQGWTGEHGVVIAKVQPDSQAASAGLQPGMLIEEVNRHAVIDAQQFGKLVQEAKGDFVLLRVKQGEYSRYVTLDANG